MFLVLLAVVVVSAACAGSDQSVVATKSTSPTSSNPTNQTTGATAGEPPITRPPCVQPKFAAQAGAIADHASTPEAALSSWLDGQFDQRTYGPVSSTKVDPVAGSSAQELRYDLVQGGQPVGDAEIRRDGEGFYVFSWHTCGQSEDTGTTAP